MTSDGDTVALLERALGQTAGLIAAIDASQAGLATPCAGWDVRALVSHLTGQDLRNFIVAARGEAADWQAPADQLGDNWPASFRDRADSLRAVWQEISPGSSQRPATSTTSASGSPAGAVAVTCATVPSAAVSRARW